MRRLKSALPDFLILAPVLVVSPLLLFPRLRYVWVAALVPLAWFVSLWLRRSSSWRTPLNVLLIPVLLMVGVSVWATFDIPFSLGKIAGAVLGIYLYLALAGFATTSPRVRLAVATFLLAGGGLALLSFVGTRWKGRLPVPREIATLLPTRFKELPGAEEGFHANPVGATMLLFLIPLFLVVWNRRSVSPRRAITVCSSFLLLLTGTVLLLSESRGAWLGMATATSLLFVINYRLVRWMALVVVTVGGVTVAVVQPTTLWQRILEADEISGGGGMVVGRLEVWSRAVYGIQDFPFTGMGMNTFRKIVHVLYPLFSVGPDFDVASCHSQILQTGLDLGIPGMVAYVAIWTALFRMLWAVWRRGENRFHQVVAQGLFGGLVAQSVFLIADSIPLGAKVGILWWFAAGIVAAIFKLEFPNLKRKARTWEMLLLWVLLSLVSISFVGDHPYWALGIGTAGGVYLGWEATRGALGAKQDSPLKPATGRSEADSTRNANGPMSTDAS